MREGLKSFRKAVSILDGREGFGGALWWAELESAAQSREELRAAAPSDQHNVFESSMHRVREAMAKAIFDWMPRYGNLAVAFAKFSEPDPIEWTRSKVRTLIKKRLREPNRDGAIAYILITMSGNDVEEKTRWRAPNYMFGSERQSGSLRGDATEFVIRTEHAALHHRLENALDQAVAEFELSLLISAGNHNRHSGSHDEGQKNKRIVEIPPFRSELKTQAATYIQRHRTAVDSDIESHLRGKYPHLIPKSWDEDISAPGKLFTKVRAKMRELKLLP